MKNSVFAFRLFLLLSFSTHSLALEMEATYSSETSVDVHGAIWRYIPEDKTLCVFMCPCIIVHSRYMALCKNGVGQCFGTCSFLWGYLTVLFQASNWVENGREIQHWACYKTLERTWKHYRWLSDHVSNRIYIYEAGMLNTTLWRSMSAVRELCIQRHRGLP
jgi:hypothetical protein